MELTKSFYDIVALETGEVLAESAHVDFIRWLVNKDNLAHITEVHDSDPDCAPYVYISGIQPYM